MVFTDPVRMPADQGYPRRTVLSAGAGAAVSAVLAGCGLLDRKPAPPPGPDPLEPVRSQAQDLLDRYEAALAAEPSLAARLTPLRDAHRAHLAELTRVIGTPAPSARPSAAASTPAGSDPAGTLAALRTAEENARAAAAAVCLAVPAARAVLVASIAACRATHVEVLK
jgi:hypothetical protein